MGAVSAAELGARELPAGTVTFLFTDLEGSTALLEAHPAAYRDAVAATTPCSGRPWRRTGGVVFETVGDAVYAAFARPTDAVAAALAGQRGPAAGTGGLEAGATQGADGPAHGRGRARRGGTTSGRRCTAAPG